MKLSQLLGLAVHDSAGKKLGHVHEIRAELRGDSAHLTAIVIGPRGILERIGLGRSKRRCRNTVVPWQHITHIDLGSITTIESDPAL
jgi:sporulation protein YlmC with PRC-barrel domain